MQVPVCCRCRTPPNRPEPQPTSTPIFGSTTRPARPGTTISQVQLRPATVALGLALALATSTPSQAREWPPKPPAPPSRQPSSCPRPAWLGPHPWCHPPWVRPPLATCLGSATVPLLTRVPSVPTARASASAPAPCPHHAHATAAEAHHAPRPRPHQPAHLGVGCCGVVGRGARRRLGVASCPPRGTPTRPASAARPHPPRQGRRHPRPDPAHRGGRGPIAGPRPGF